MTDEIHRELLVGIASDGVHFVRYQCPGCGLDFKLKGDASAQQDALSWWLQETVREGGAHTRESDADLPREDTYCPYCSSSGPRQQFFHPEVVNYIRQIARREIIEPMVAKLFGGFAAGLRSSKYVTVTVSEQSARSPRPISGPEPPDQVVIECLACKCRFKVDECWRGSVRCALCSAELLPH